VPDANGRFFGDAARTAAVPMLWLYAEHDAYYSASAIRRYRAAFEEAGGQGPFSLFPEIGGTGTLWPISRCSGVPPWTPICRRWACSPRQTEAVARDTE
jgi:hypothetical protein